MVKRCKTLAVLIGLAIGMVTGAQAAAPDFLEKLSADARPAEDKARDGSRRPYQVMQLLDVQEGMTVVDVAAGAGDLAGNLALACFATFKEGRNVDDRNLQERHGILVFLFRTGACSGRGRSG